MHEKTDTTGTPADATELALRLVQETARRQQAEALAETATATADAETARAALVDLRASAVQSIAAVQHRDRAERMAAMHDGLLALRADLDGLRAAAQAALVGSTESVTSAAPARAVIPAEPTPIPIQGDVIAAGAGPSDPVAVRPSAAGPRSAVGPVAPELAQSARELLARGRLDVADDVIRGLEDAAARLRAQSLPTTDG